MNLKQAKELVRSRLSDKRYEHTINVKKMAVKLAKDVYKRQQRQCGPGHLPAAGHGAARGVSGAAVRHRTAGLQPGAGRCTV